jgi:hypothetical protein
VEWIYWVRSSAMITLVPGITQGAILRECRRLVAEIPSCTVNGATIEGESEWSGRLRITTVGCVTPTPGRQSDCERKELDRR